jgi:hypothetical protein
MASEIRSFTDPSSLQAFGGLVSGEQMYDQMGRQQFANMQNAQLAREQMAQEYNLAQQRMAQNQQQMEQSGRQFESGLLEAQREREFRTGEREAEQKFQMDQMAAYRKWEQQKTNELRAFELQLEEIDVEEQEARAKGQASALASIAARRQAIQTEQAKRSMEIAQAQMIVGQSKESATRMIGEFSTKLQQQISATQAAQQNGSSFASSLINAMSEDSRSAAAAALGLLRSNQYGDPLGRSAADVNAATTAATIGNLPGSEFLILRPDVLATLKSLSPGQTIDASFVAGEVDPADMTRMLQERISKATVGVARGLGLRNETALREALMLATGGGNKAEVMDKLIASGLDPTTAKSLFANAAEQIETAGLERVQQLSEQAASASKGQDSLAIRALAQERKAQSALASMFRNAASKITVADTNTLEVGLAHLKDIIQRGELSQLSTSTLSQALGRDTGDIAALLSEMGRGRSAAQQVALGSVELGNLAERGAGNEQLDLLEMLAAQQAGTGTRRARLEKIRKSLSP